MKLLTILLFLLAAYLAPEDVEAASAPHVFACVLLSLAGLSAWQSGRY